MKRRGTALLTAAVAARLAAAPAAQDPDPNLATGIQFPASASAVVLDVVVRDGKGRPVRNLTAADFEAIEDGVPQLIEAFHSVSMPRATVIGARPSPGTTAPPSAASRPAPDTAPAILAFVFDRLSPAARAVAHRAAMEAVREGAPLRGRTGVFAIDRTLLTLQPYTDDVALVRQALDRAGSRSASTFGSESDGRGPSAVRALGHLMPREPAVHAPESAREVVADDPMGELEPIALSHLNRQEQLFQLMIARSLRQMEAFHEALAREQQGFATTNGLLAVVSSLEGLPGRKSVVLFSEGLAVPHSVQPQLRSVVDAATRAGVSLYAVDAAGLRVTSPLADSRGTIQSYTARRERATENKSGIGLTELESNEDALQRDPQAALGALADATGGFLIRDTNDLVPGLGRVDDDAREYYVVAYTPKNQDYDGRFRRVAVRVRGDGRRVRTRKGYYAVRATNPGPVLPHEAPALAVLDRDDRPRRSTVHVAGLSFPEPAGGRRAPILVTVPARTLAYRVEGDRYRAEFSIVARVKSPGGAVLRKLSQPYELEGPRSALDAVRASEVFFYRETTLPPGRFVLEAAVYDALAREGMVAEGELSVPADEPGAIRASSLVIVKAAQRAPAGQQPSGALTSGDVLVYPLLGGPVSRTQPLVSVFFSVCVPPGSAAPPAVVEVRQGTVVRRSPLRIPEPDGDGCLRSLAGVPLAGLKAGEHELRLVLGEGEQALPSARFVLAE